MARFRPVARNVLRAAIVSIVRGDVLYGVFCLVALALTTVISRLAWRAETTSPIAIDLVLLTLMVLDMALGNTLGLYLLWPWYDKMLHFGSSIMIGLVGFLAIYVVHAKGKIKFHPWLDGVAILLVTLGLGAFWEIGEYAVDKLFGLATQGAPQFNALDDTMIDLILDAIGGCVAAVLGPIYMRRSRRSRQRVRAIATWLGHRA